MNFVLIPLITEKSMKDAAAFKYTFKAPEYASKDDIKKNIEHKFEVNVLDIATTTVKGKRTRVGERRIEKRDLHWKKAIVKVKNGQKIGLFELGEKKWN